MADVFEVVSKMGVDALHAGVICSDGVLHEHGHAAPLRQALSGSADPPGCRLKQLTYPGRPDGDSPTDQGETWRMALEHSGRPEWSDHFIVAHVDDEQVRVMPGALARDGQHNVGVDARHGGVDDLPFHVGVGVLEHDAQNAVECKRRRRHSLGCRSPQDKDPIGVVALVRGQTNR